MSIVRNIKQAGLATEPNRVRVWPRVLFFALLGGCSLILVAIFARAVDSWNAMAWLILVLMCANALWISAGAATAIVGLFTPKIRHASLPAHWKPVGKTAVLVTLCGEDPAPIAQYLAQLKTGLDRTGLGIKTEIFVLSDTFGDAAIEREDKAFAELVHQGVLTLRRRTQRTDKKPGNIHDWLVKQGDNFDYMLVLDADSRMSPQSIGRLIWALERDPKVGLCQAAISLLPGRTRFGRYQRLTSRLLAPVFVKGFAAWTGRTGNYWGHNAIIRVKAFREAAPLPKLSGKPPFGGTILSHDFIEAAWMRRAGWHIQVCPGTLGSAEDAPQTIEEFFKRDRRWCQGNLQHLRLVAEPGLHWLSRFHLILGIASYLAAPIWVILLVLLTAESIEIWGFLPVICIAVVLFIPKLCALITLLPRATSKGRRVILRAWGAEILISSVLAPIVMLRQASFVVQILFGQDSGWKSGTAGRFSLPLGWPEAVLGLGILAFALINQNNGVFWLALLILPLLIAPLFLPKLNEVVQ